LGDFFSQTHLVNLPSTQKIGPNFDQAIDRLWVVSYIIRFSEIAPHNGRQCSFEKTFGFRKPFKDIYI
jgi:hypothetical protein